MFFYVPTGGTTCTKAFCVDIDTGKWSQREWQQGIIGSVQVTDDTDRAVLLLGDENGYTWRVAPDEFDGVPTGYAAVHTADVGCTTTSWFQCNKGIDGPGRPSKWNCSSCPWRHSICRCASSRRKQRWQATHRHRENQ